ncbi:hypothetical protein P3X46_001942 [Hevea brasiliensis]|uniref:DUF7796 domain-containing protein n=1 Tax=Hevea brasiliensis TaxID=3981 RepID=A0ABQ9N1D4_HEVBR|nr:uncharacterized protein LOC110661000 [Hevea brasiliensis]KAJ9186362.1 hypothetical protein P3X46_001942 [Hevea brasiliensis]
MVKTPQEFAMYVARWFSDLDWKLLLLFVPPLFIIVFLFVSATPVSPLSTFAPLASFFFNRTTSADDPCVLPLNRSQGVRSWEDELYRSRMAVCLVGGARRFELTGPSIVENILNVYPNSDLFLHCPLDENAFKFSLLKLAPRIATVRIFQPKPIPETEAEVRVLTASNSPNGIQGLLQYFNLVEGCLTMIEEYQNQNNFKYDWVVRTRVDGYWNAPLAPENFITGHYLVPPGSTYGGLNDRLGIGDFNSSAVALSRLSLIPKLDSAGLRMLNSETSFKAQLTTYGVPVITKRLPFCIVSDRKYGFPPYRFGVPVAALSSPGPLSGAKCRPCTPVCEGSCVEGIMSWLDKGWSWTNWESGTLKLCDAHGEWEKEWETIFDKVAGKKRAAVRKRIWGLKLKQCVNDFNEMKRRSSKWDSPPPEEICSLGVGEN